MSAGKQEELFDREQADREGVFDAQLSLPLPYVAAPPPLRTLVKRDGREEPFDKRKIADAIFKAAQSAGGQDYHLAESLASAVAIYMGKQPRTQPPTVDHVHDAVERVLIQMSHAKTALAYARYRDRRARIRRLRQGDMQALLSELEEARHEREALGRGGNGSLFVRTTSDTVDAWDRGKIVEALVRETGIEQGVAELVALEVEEQIQHAEIKTLTTSLVRELVDAKLVEHGLGDYRERHRRLGVPLYDTERIVRGTTPETVSQDPAATDRVLARSVKKEYALAQVFSGPAAEAHLRGEIHLHHLGLVDRLCRAEHSLESVARYGVRTPGGGLFAAPPKRADTLLAQMLQCEGAFRALFADGPNWHALNVYFAPFLQSWPAQDLLRFAQMLVYEYSYRALTHGAPTRPTEIGLCWTVPAALGGREAVGPGGATTGQAYGAYGHTTQQFAWALIEVLLKGGADGIAFPAPVPVVHLDAAFFRASGQERFLHHVSRLAALRKKVHFRFDRECSEAAPGPAPWRARDVVLQRVTLNLPRAAYRGGKEPALFRELDRLLDIAVTAHQEKHAFLDGLLHASGSGPLGMLALAPGGDGPYVDLDEGFCLVAVDGLNECVQALLNVEMHANEEASAQGERILEHLRAGCAARAERTGLRVALAQNDAPAVSRRFATLDVKDYPKTAGAAVKADPETQALSYSTGVRLRRGHGLDPINRVRSEGAFHAFLGHDTLTEVPLPLDDTSFEAVADFIQKVYHQTSNRRIVFV